MRIPQSPRQRLLLAICVLLLLSALPSFGATLIKLVIALAVAAVAWHAAGLRQKEDSAGAAHTVQNHAAGHSGSVHRCVFSSDVIDLTDSSLLPERIELQAAFASVSVRLPVDAAVTLHASGAFCSITMPGAQCIALGERTVQCGTQDPSAPRLYIDASCAFGSLSFRMG